MRKISNTDGENIVDLTLCPRKTIKLCMPKKDEVGGGQQDVFKRNEEPEQVWNYGTNCIGHRCEENEGECCFVDQGRVGHHEGERKVGQRNQSCYKHTKVSTRGRRLRRVVE